MRCKCNLETTEAIIKLLDKFKVPFRCSECSGIYYPYRALNGVVFIWGKPVETITAGGIHIPEISKDQFKTSYGIVLTAGKGCENTKTKEYTECELTPGDVVIYDKNVPWKMQVEASDGKFYEVALMNMFDVSAIVEDYEG